MLEPIEAASLKNLASIRHGFFTRKGGQSAGIYAGLNCGFGSNDERATIEANRQAIARHLDPTADRVITVYQTHSAQAVTLDAPPDPNALPKADAIVTTTPGLVIAILTADCAPVLFADPDSGVIAAAHAGWRGAVGGILEATWAAMERAGARRESTIAAIGPCIHQRSYEVGQDFHDELLRLSANNDRFFTIPPQATKHHFNLPAFVFSKLKALNLGTASTSTACTYENESNFFSYRRSRHRQEADYGRQISAIVLDKA